MISQAEIACIDQLPLIPLLRDVGLMLASIRTTLVECVVFLLVAGLIYVDGITGHSVHGMTTSPCTACVHPLTLAVSEALD